jgi:hypothetical protein
MCRTCHASVRGRIRGSTVWLSVKGIWRAGSGFGRASRTAGLELYEDGAANLHARLDWDGKRPSVMMGSHLDTVPGGGPPGRRAGRAGGPGGDAHHQGVRGEAQVSPGGGGFHRRGGPLRRPVRLPGHRRTADPRERSTMPGIWTVSASPRPWRPGAGCQRRPVRAACTGIHGAYLELHIEQGPVLDRNHVSIGVVDAITGLFKWDVRLMGQTNHAGTTPMDMRADSLPGAGRVRRRDHPHPGGARQPPQRATIGRVELKPGAANTVPGRPASPWTCATPTPRPRRIWRMPSAAPSPALARRRDLMFEFDVLRRFRPRVAIRGWCSCSRRPPTGTGSRASAHAQRCRPRRPDHGLGDPHRHDLRAQPSRARAIPPPSGRPGKTSRRAPTWPCMHHATWPCGHRLAVGEQQAKRKKA